MLYFLYKKLRCVKNEKKVFIKIVYLAIYQDKKNVLVAPKK